MVGLERNGALGPPLARVSDAIAEALRSGATTDDIFNVIALKTAEHETPFTEFCLVDCAEVDVVYTELPVGLITVPDAAKKYEISRRTIQTWLRKNQLQQLGRLKAPARGGGYILVCETQLVEFMHSPRNKGGRPPKQ